MRKSIFILFLSLSSLALLAQQDSIPVDSISGRSPYTKFKKEFSFDVRGILYAAPTASVTYRIRYGEKYRINLYNKKVFRIYGNGYLGFPLNERSQVDTTSIPNFYYYSATPYEREYSDMNLFVGLEKQHFFGKLVFYRGLEIGGGWSHAISKYFFTNSSRAENTNTVTTQETKVLLSCFAGLKYFLNPRISLSVECNVLGGVGFWHQSFDYYLVNTVVPGSNIHTSTEFFELNPIIKINGLRALNINYHF